MGIKTNAWYIKSTVIAVLLFVETLYLTHLMEIYIKAKEYFSLQFTTPTILLIIATLCLILITYTLSIGSWGRYEQYITVALPITLAITIFLSKYNIFNAILSGILIQVALCLEIYMSTKLKAVLTRFDPIAILTISEKWLLSTYSALAVLILMFGKTQENIYHLNIGEIAATLMQNIGENVYYMEHLNASIISLLTNQINSVVEPYRDLFKPILSIYLFMLFRFIASIAYLIYSVLITPIFHIAKATGFIKIEKVMVEQETPTF